MNTCRTTMARPGKASRAPAAASGFTLVEVMISMVVGLFIVMALVTLLINVNRNNGEMTKTNRVIENGRYALTLLQEDVSHASFWGGYIPQFDDLTASLTTAPTDLPTAVPDPCLPFTTPWAAADKLNLLAIGVQSYAVASPVGTPAVPVCASAPSNLITSAKGNTDVLVVRHVDTCAIGDTNCAALAANALYFQPSRCGTDTSTFSMEAYDPATYNISVLNLHKRDCVATTFVETRKFISNMYYVRDYAVTAGDGIPTLMRSEFGVSSGVPAQQPAQAMIEGIEGFRVEFGVDSVSDSGAAVNQAQAITWANPNNRTSPTNRGDGIPDGAYIRCANAGCTWQQLINVVAVKLYVLVRSENATPGYTDNKTYTLGSTTLGPFGDSYKRHLFSQTVRLANVATRRETP